MRSKEIRNIKSGLKVGHSSRSIPFEITRELGSIRSRHSRRLDCHKLFYVSTFHNKPAQRSAEEDLPEGRLHQVTVISTRNRKIILSS